MKILFVASMLALATVGISREECRGFCFLIIDPACGFDETCNYEGDNSCMVKYEDCRRKQLNKPPFKFINSGKCPNDKPQCPRTNL